MESDHKRIENSTFWSNLGVDLSLKIFAGFSMKSLGQFRCVCKSWNSLISSPAFAAGYPSFTVSATPANRKPYLLKHADCSVYRPQQPDQLVRRVYFPFVLREFAGVGFDFVDVIHGVVCVSYSGASSFNSITLWNPAIRKYVAIPRLPTNKRPLESKMHVIMPFWRSQPNAMALGFGFDSSKNDFKVVRVWIPNVYNDFKNESLPPTYELYSYREGHWREGVAHNIKPYGFITTTSCFLNGTIHWLVTTPKIEEKPNKYSLLMFNCEQELFSPMELPEEFNPFQMPNITGRRVQLNIELLKYLGMLSVLLYSPREPRVELWAMEEHGLASTWKKLICVQEEIEFDRNLIMLSEDGDIHQYTLKELEFSGPKKPCLPLNGCVYEESMFLMEGIECKCYTKHEIVHI